VFAHLVRVRVRVRARVSVRVGVTTVTVRVRVRVRVRTRARARARARVARAPGVGGVDPYAHTGRRWLVISPRLRALAGGGGGGARLGTRLLRRHLRLRGRLLLQI